jgi:tRNA nucleotidyltransferase (CCA-adding enzyme)
MEARPARMFETLAACGALARIAPELSQPPDSLWRALDRSAAQGRVLAVRSAVWVGEGGLDAVQVETLGERLRMPSDCMELGILTVREGAAIAHLDAPDAKGLLDLIERCDALRRRERFDRLLQAIVDLTDRPLAGAAALLHRAVDAVRQVDAGKIAQAVARADIGSAVRQARLEAVAALLG